MKKMHKVLLLPNTTKKIPAEQIEKIIARWEGNGCRLYTFPECAAFLGSRIPVFHAIDEENWDAACVLRGNMDKAYANYLRMVLHKKKNIDTDTLFIPYAGCSARQLKEFRERAGRYQKFDQIILQKTSATISSNCGLGAIGVSYIRKAEDTKELL